MICNYLRCIYEYILDLIENIVELAESLNAVKINETYFPPL